MRVALIIAQHQAFRNRKRENRGDRGGRKAGREREREKERQTERGRNIFVELAAAEKPGAWRHAIHANMTAKD